MANAALTLTQLSRIALVAGLDMGFNAAGVERWLDAETFEPRLAITWGEQKQMRKPQLRTPCEWALSYSEEDRCMREPKTVEFPESVIFEASYDIEKRFRGELLELCHDT